MILPGRSGRGELGDAAYGEPRQAEVGAGEEAQVDGIAIQADVFQLPPGVFVLLRVTEGVPLQGLSHVILERTHQTALRLCLESFSCRWGADAAAGWEVILGRHLLSLQLHVQPA